MTLRNFAGKTCLITGAASGIGRAVAIAAAQEGAELVLTDINGPQLEETTRHIRDNGGKVRLFHAMDISDYESVRQFAKTVLDELGSIDIVMNVAGISIWGRIEHLDHANWQRTIDVNLMGPIHVMECFIPAMIHASRGGHLVNVSSAAGLFGLPWHAAYSASKFGLRGISEVLRFDLHRHGIGVSLVCPGAVNTGLVQTLDIRGIDKNNRDYLMLLKRFQRHAVSPEKAADAIIKGIKNNRHMVFTSLDIRMGYWFQRKFPPLYDLVMRAINNRVEKSLST